MYRRKPGGLLALRIGSGVSYGWRVMKRGCSGSAGATLAIVGGKEPGMHLHTRVAAIVGGLALLLMGVGAMLAPGGTVRSVAHAGNVPAQGTPTQNATPGCSPGWAVVASPDAN